MNKYKVGDKIVLTVSDVNEKAYYSYYVFNNNDLILWEPSTDNYVEPLYTYTKPLEAKIRRQAAEITRLLRENKELKNEKQELNRERNQLMGRCGGLSAAKIKAFNNGRLAGQNEAWSLCNEICKRRKVNEIQDMFNHLGINEFCQLFDRPYSEIAEKFAKWEKANEENKVRVGDVLHYKYDKAKCICVTAVESNDNFNGVDKYGNTFLNRCDDVWEKTGRHIDIDGFLKQIGGEQE